MTLLAYAVVRDAEPYHGPLPTGVAGTPVRLVAADGLAFACSDAPPSEEPSVERLLEYARTVDALHRIETVLPLRFGNFGPEERLRAKLRSRRDEFAADLARLGGCEEMTVSVGLPEPPAAPAAPPSTPGAGYLLARRQRYTRGDAARATADRIAAESRTRFAGLFVDLQLEHPANGRPDVAAVHFLIRRGAGDELATAVRREEHLFGGPCRLSGPWPVYHFLTPPPPLLAHAKPTA